MFGDLFFTLYNKRLFNSCGDRLSQVELQKLFAFYNLIVGGGYSQLIMRGESDENLRQQFIVDTETPVALAGYLFMIGEKARVCWTDQCYMDPDDTSVENFKRIVEALSHYIHDGQRGVGRRVDRLNEFAERNEDFCRALDNNSRISDVYRRLKTEDRIAANLYYLSLSHTINSLKYKNASSFVSATTEAHVAERFAADTMIYGWVPKNTRKGSYRGRTIDHVAACSNKTMKRMGLPYPETAVYPEQCEVSVRCGLLPHFIIGFTVKNSFYVNPAIFSTIDKMDELTSFKELSRFKRDIQLFGMDANQDLFWDLLPQTGYKKYVIFDGKKYVICHLD